MHVKIKIKNNNLMNSNNPLIHRHWVLNAPINDKVSWKYKLKLVRSYFCCYNLAFYCKQFSKKNLPFNDIQSITILFFNKIYIQSNRFSIKKHIFLYNYYKLQFNFLFFTLLLKKSSFLSTFDFMDRMKKMKKLYNLHTVRHNYLF